MGLLAWSLAKRIHPWEQILTIHTGMTLEGGSSDSNLPLNSLSPDQSQLASVRPDGSCELWDLQKRRLVSTIEKPPRAAEGEGTSEPSVEARSVLHFEDGRILITYDSSFLICDPGGYPLTAHQLAGWSTHHSISPNGDQVANAQRWQAMNYNLKTRANTELATGGGLNGGHTRLQWLSDDRHILLNDLLAFILFDTHNNEIVYRRNYLDVRLPPPMFVSGFREEDTETRLESRQFTAHLVDSQLADGESRIVSLYEANSLANYLTPKNPDTFRLRFYEAATGTLLKDDVLPHSPACLRVSADCTQVSVLMSRNGVNVLRVYDARTMTMTNEIPYRFGHFAHQSFEPLADNRTVVTQGHSVVLLDLEDEYAPLMPHAHTLRKQSLRSHHQ